MENNKILDAKWELVKKMEDMINDYEAGKINFNFFHYSYIVLKSKVDALDFVLGAIKLEKLLED